MDWRIRYDNYVEIYFNGKSPLKGIVLCQTVKFEMLVTDLVLFNICIPTSCQQHQRSYHI